MRHSLVQIESFQVAGLPIRTNNATEQMPNGKISALWSDFFAQDLFGIEERIQGSPVYGVYTNYESDQTGYFDVIAGVKVTAAPKTHLQTITINAGDYLVFDTHGAMPQRMIEGWQKVWAYFTDDAPYTRLYTTDFEQMIDENDMKIFIAVKPA
jgi:predicted transcriptional regulator YdeE